MPPKDVLFIQDASFIEEIHKFIPEKIDWTLEKECGGHNVFGFETIGDLRTIEES